MKKGWQIVALEDVCEFVDRRGVTPEKLGAGFLSDGYRVISAKNIKGRQIDTTIGEQRFVDEPTYRRWMRSPLLVDDVILTSEAPLGEPAYVDEELAWCLGQRLFGIRTAKSKLHGRFLFYALQASPVRNDMLSRATGATAQGIRQAELKKVQLPLPPVIEQRRIVRILDEAFDGLARATANAEQNLRNARALFESHLQSVFTQWGKGWVEKPLKELTERITKGSSPKWQGIAYVEKPGILFVTSENVGVNEILLDEPKYVEEKFNQKDKKSILRPGDVLTNIVGASIGRTAVFDRDDVANINQAVCLIRCLPELLLNRFLAYFLNSPVLREILHAGEVNMARANLSLGFFSELPVACPSLTEQVKVVEELDALAAETRRLESIYQHKLAALGELKKSLLHQAFSGEL